MLKIAYNKEELEKHSMLKASANWCKSGIISSTQLEDIKREVKSNLYNPSIIIRILLFIAGLIASSALFGLFGLSFFGNETGIKIGSLLYGIASFICLEFYLIQSKHHYKSGVSELLLYQAIGCTFGGLSLIMDLPYPLFLILLGIVFTFSAIRYLDIVSTIGSVYCVTAFLLYLLHEAGGTLLSLAPFIFMVAFSFILFRFQKIKSQEKYMIWRQNMILVEGICLILIYLSGNYFVVREMSLEFMHIHLSEGEDIPLAFLFYATSILIPLLYLYFGIAKKNIITIRVALLVIAFTAFTFKYYFSLGHPEVSLTIAGIVLLLVAILVLTYLKVYRKGFTRETLLNEKWMNLNLEAIVISQTVGGNAADSSEKVKMGGGEFGGAGGGGNF